MFPPVLCELGSCNMSFPLHRVFGFYKGILPPILAETPKRAVKVRPGFIRLRCHMKTVQPLQRGAHVLIKHATPDGLSCLFWLLNIDFQALTSSSWFSSSWSPTSLSPSASSSSAFSSSSSTTSCYALTDSRPHRVRLARGFFGGFSFSRTGT